jgi:hypothetical protein
VREAVAAESADDRLEQSGFDRIVDEAEGLFRTVVADTA